MMSIDIGGTKTEVRTYDKLYNVAGQPIRVPTHSFKAFGEVGFFSEIVDFIKKCSTNESTIGIALKGAVRQGSVVYSSLAGGNVSIPLAEMASNETLKNTVVCNDIHPLVVAEKYCGLGKSLDNFLVLNLGTGVGVAAFHRGVLLGNGMAGLVGKSRLFVDELGQSRSIDSLLGGKGVSELYKEISGREMSTSEVFATSTMNKNSEKVVRIFKNTLTEFLALLSCHYNPSLIVITGSLKLAVQEFISEVRIQYAIGKGTRSTWLH